MLTGSLVSVRFLSLVAHLVITIIIFWSKVLEHLGYTVGTLTAEIIMIVDMLETGYSHSQTGMRPAPE